MVSTEGLIPEEARPPTLPEQQILVNLFLSSRCQFLRDLYIKRLGSIQVDRQYKPGRLIDRELAWFGAFQDLVRRNWRDCGSYRYILPNTR